jgi:hypothetical protein
VRSLRNRQIWHPLINNYPSLVKDIVVVASAIKFTTKLKLILSFKH